MSSRLWVRLGFWVWGIVMSKLGKGLSMPALLTRQVEVRVDAGRLSFVIDDRDCGVAATGAPVTQNNLNVQK